MSRLSDADLEFIRDAERFFRDPGAVIKGLNWLSSKVQKGTNLLPASVQTKLTRIVNVSLQQALKVSLKTIGKDGTKGSNLPDARAASQRKGRLHAFAAAMTGGFSGYFGLPTVLLELPVTTMILLRSMLEIARECGEDLDDPRSTLECLIVFSLGGPGDGDDLTDSAYYETRASMAALVQAAANFIAAHPSKHVLEAIERGSAPAVVNFIARIASVFQVRVTKKMLAQATPVIGAAGGAAVNIAFSNFYNKAALYHFGLRKLERKYGEATIRGAYSSIAATHGKAV